MFNRIIIYLVFILLFFSCLFYVQKTRPHFSPDGIWNSFEDTFLQLPTLHIPLPCLRCWVQGFGPLLQATVFQVSVSFVELRKQRKSLVTGEILSTIQHYNEKSN